MLGLRWLRARMGVRVASALAAAAAVAVVLVVAGFSLVLLLNRSLQTQLDEAATQQAEQVGQRIAANFTATGNVRDNALDTTGKRTDLIQVVTDWNNDDPDEPDIQIIAASDPLASMPRMSDVLVERGRTRVVGPTRVELGDGTSQEVQVVAVGFQPFGRPITILAAQPLEPVHKAVDTVKTMVYIGVPILVVIAGFFTYLFAGRALRPVERIRAHVASLTDRDLDRRVPEPVTQDEIGRLAATMNQMLGRLEGAQTNQRRFVADASHELRSPLATISSGLELIAAAHHPDSPDGATVRSMRTEADRLGRLVDGLLLLARADERGLQPRHDEVDLDEIVEAERGRPSDIGGARVGADGVTVRAEPVRVVGDRGQLVRVVRNLVDNARRHAESRVLVTLRREGDRAVVEVGDDGPGVPPEQRTRVFERFVRLDEARARSDGGAGLGLAIVAEVIAAHGGGVEIGESELGGALFRVTLPAGPAAERDPAETAPSRQETQPLYDDRPTGPTPVVPPGGRPRPRPEPTSGPVPVPQGRPASDRPGREARDADPARRGPLTRGRQPDGAAAGRPPAELLAVRGQIAQVGSAIR
ncbi:sensor histidine kinase [Pseudonocardia sp. T1-2H]|uniref:sensor histidine kinase n=1 Tax=Pseudonocardia sp. T1-2H TaxID=3128899 RepID=UPI003101A4DC